MPITRSLKLILIIILFTSCSTQKQTVVNDIESSTPSLNNLGESEVNTLIESTLIPQASRGSAPTKTPNPNEVEFLLKEGCPKITEQTFPLWQDGSVLYTIGNVDHTLSVLPNVGDSDIQAISSDNVINKVIYDIPNGQSSQAFLSPDNTKLLRFEADSEGQYLLLYDLIEQTERERVTINTSPFLFKEWLPDGRLKFLTNLERNYGLGEKHYFSLIDPITGESEASTEELELPNYEFYEDPIYTGVVSMDPTKDKVLYTLLGSLNTADVALLDRETNMIVWQQVGSLGSHGYPYPKPSWSLNGDSVLFGMPVTENGQTFFKLIRLALDGHEKDMLNQPFPQLHDDPARILALSNEGRYIHYAVRETPVTGSGYIVDTLTAEIKEICSSDTLFLDGIWISENQFLYRVLQKDDSQSLRMLDIPTWTIQVLHETDTNYGFNIIGWTPVEFQ